MFKLAEKENIIIKEAKNAVAANKKIFIYGCGEIGKYICNVLLKESIAISGFLVDASFYIAGMSYGEVPVYNLDNYSIDKNMLVVIAMRNYDKEKVLRLSKECSVVDEDVFSLHMVDNFSPISFEFIECNKEGFSKLYDSLADDKSRKCMEAFLNQKISGKFEYLKDIWEKNQYYDKDIVDFGKIQTFVDCGAYDGDSFLAFAKNYRKHTGNIYRGGVYLLEPDEENYQKMVKNCKVYDNCKFCKMGAWNERKTLVFSSGTGTSSGIAETGDSKIEVDTIDHLTEAKADFIKMDIEGAELAALQGAEETIRNCHPTLAICVYHKKEDLLAIPQYIKSLCPQYKLYLRAYSKWSQELVLYAIYE